MSVTAGQRRLNTAEPFKQQRYKVENDFRRKYWEFYGHGNNHILTNNFLCSQSNFLNLLKSQRCTFLEASAAIDLIYLRI